MNGESPVERDAVNEHAGVQNTCTANQSIGPKGTLDG